MEASKFSKQKDGLYPTYKKQLLPISLGEIMNNFLFLSTSYGDNNAN